MLIFGISKPQCFVETCEIAKDRFFYYILFFWSANILETNNAVNSIFKRADWKSIINQKPKTFSPSSVCSLHYVIFHDFSKSSNSFLSVIFLSKANKSGLKFLIIAKKNQYLWIPFKSSKKITDSSYDLWLRTIRKSSNFGWMNDVAKTYILFINIFTDDQKRIVVVNLPLIKLIHLSIRNWKKKNCCNEGYNRLEYWCHVKTSSRLNKDTHNLKVNNI